jgi:hypothetical protein
VGTVIDYGNANKMLEAIIIGTPCTGYFLLALVIKGILVQAI